jgi:flavin reductase (DIM6/NTAB) family NADH-FMN oxidoreductase RutF
MSSNPLESHPASVDKREFCRTCAQFATGVAVAAVVDAAGEARGLTVNSFTSVSLAPPLVLICIAHTAGALPSFRSRTHFGLSLLTEEQRGLSDRFAERGRDRFQDTPWCPGVTGAPLLPDALAWVECRVERVETAGDHDILIAEVVRTVVRGGHPLIYYGSAYRHLERV